MGDAVLALVPSRGHCGHPCHLRGPGSLHELPEAHSQPVHGPSLVETERPGEEAAVSGAPWWDLRSWQAVRLLRTPPRASEAQALSPVCPSRGSVTLRPQSGHRTRKPGPLAPVPWHGGPAAPLTHLCRGWHGLGMKVDAHLPACPGALDVTGMGRCGPALRHHGLRHHGCMGTPGSAGALDPQMGPGCWGTFVTFRVCRALGLQRASQWQRGTGPGETLAHDVRRDNRARRAKMSLYTSSLGRGGAVCLGLGDSEAGCASPESRGVEGRSSNTPLPGGGFQSSLGPSQGRRASELCLGLCSPCVCVKTWGPRAPPLRPERWSLSLGSRSLVLSRAAVLRLSPFIACLQVPVSCLCPKLRPRVRAMCLVGPHEDLPPPVE